MTKIPLDETKTKFKADVKNWRDWLLQTYETTGDKFYEAHAGAFNMTLMLLDEAGGAEPNQFQILKCMKRSIGHGRGRF